MSKWQKKLAIVATGSLVVGALFLAAGVLTGGIQDAQSIYADALGKEYQHKLGLEQVEHLDIDLSTAYVHVETGDVKTVQVSYLKKEDQSHFVFKEDKDSNKLTVTDNTDYLSKPIINTDFIQFFAYLNSNRDYLRDEVTITLPKGSGLKDVKLKLDIGVASLKDVTIEELQLNMTDSGVTINNTSVAKSQFSGDDGSIYLTDSQIAQGRMELSGVDFVSEKTNLKNLTITSTDSSLLFDGTLEDMAITGQNGVIDMGKVDYRGKIAIECMDATITFVYNHQNYSLDFETRDGDIYFNDDVLTENFKGYQSDDISKKLKKTVESSLATIEVKSQTGDIMFNSEERLIWEGNDE